MRPQGGKSVGFRFQFGGWFHFNPTRGGILLLVSQSASGNFFGAQTHNAESVDVANSPGTWFLALSTQGVFGEFRCEVSREPNNNMLRCWEWEDYISWKIYLLCFFFWKGQVWVWLKVTDRKLNVYIEIFSFKFIFRQLLMEQNMSLGSWLLEPFDGTWGGFRVGHGFECWSPPTLVASLNFRRQNELVQCSKRMNPVSGRDWRLEIALLVFCQSDCLRGWSWKIEQKLINLTHFCKRILQFYLLEGSFNEFMRKNIEPQILKAKYMQSPCIWSGPIEAAWTGLYLLDRRGDTSGDEEIPSNGRHPKTKKLLRSRIGTNILFWKHLEHPGTNRFSIFVLHLSFSSIRTPLAILGASPVCTCLQGCGADPGDWTKAHSGGNNNKEQQKVTR